MNPTVQHLKRIQDKLQQLLKQYQLLQKENVKLIDCQVFTTHLESMGARMIARAIFAELLAANIE